MLLFRFSLNSREVLQVDPLVPICMRPAAGRSRRPGPPGRCWRRAPRNSISPGALLYYNRVDKPACRRVARAQAHPPASAVRPRRSRSDSHLRLGSFALGTGRSPMSKPHVPCVWKRLAGRPTGGAGPSPPTSKRCNAPSFGIGQSLAPWIIRPRHGPQPDEQAACALHFEPPGGSTHGWRGCGHGPKSTHQQAL